LGECDIPFSGSSLAKLHTTTLARAGSHDAVMGSPQAARAVSTRDGVGQPGGVRKEAAGILPEVPEERAGEDAPSLACKRSSGGLRHCAAAAPRPAADAKSGC